MNREWHYLLLGESDFYTWAGNGATFHDIARLTAVSLSSVTGRLFD